MNDDFTIEGIAALLTQLAAVQMERDEYRVRTEAAEAEVARLTAESAALIDWRECALSVGEVMAPTGPEGYYDMTPAAWWEWAIKSASALRARVAELEAELNREIKHRRLLAGAAQYYGCPYCGNPIDLPAPPQE